VSDVVDGVEVAPTGFAALGLDPRLVEAVAAGGYADPTPIQAQAIPPLAAGKDLIGRAATGTGKTAAFSLPLLHRLAVAEARTGVFALVLVPTRELAVQVAKAVTRYGKPVNAKVVAVYGGAGMGDQITALRRGADVVVATPGRALDHLRRGTLSLADTRTVVLDEADEMLDMGFADDLDALLSATPPTRQTALFSATFPPRIAAIAAKHLSDPVRVTITPDKPVAGEAAKVREVLFLVDKRHKPAALARVLDGERPASAIVFCRTRHECEDVAGALAARGHRPVALHGGLSQEQRDGVMGRFRAGSANLLVATDVAARGLDIGHLSHVVNFGVPVQAEVYVHRIGRVGRAGREGVAVTVADPSERRLIQAVERLTARRLQPGKLATGAELVAAELTRTRLAVEAALAAGTSADLKPLAADLLNGRDPAEVLAAVLGLAVTPPADVADIPTLTADRPARPAGGVRPSPARGPVRGMGRVFVGAGRASGVGRREVLAAIEHEVGLDSRDIGRIEVAERFCTVEVPAEAVDEVVDRLDGVRFRGRRTQVRPDRLAV
jgi:ATP-dependent RNA helicase DeaD